ncbi:MAG TPA: hypothetical protein VK158_05495, partial [Acidobacteriota bacterium]|nr:hypothetical protein [Acidobacteriota bacterium]
YGFSLTMISSKRAMDANQLFVYITTVVVVGLVLLFGSQAVLKFKSDTDKISFAKELEDFNRKVSEVSTEFRSEKMVSLEVPDGVATICIIDIYKDKPATCPVGDISNPVCDYWQSYRDSLAPTAARVDPKNVFFLDSKGLIVGDSAFVKSVEIDLESPLTPASYVCSTGDSFTLYLRGETRKAVIYSFT